ncbi:MAG: 30S ribosomal protein S6 [Candidatus Eremiobacteraeota bacterium]|nr:30S ribosomal protein S6 [Candidatus Eremiobacteraeota bacterium]
MPTTTLDYEVTYILRPQLEEAETEAQIAHVADQLRQNGGEVVGDIERMGKRRLAYEIADVREGYYVVMRFKSDAAQAKELERLLGLNENVLRALLIRPENPQVFHSPPPAPAPPPQASPSPSIGQPSQN